MLMRSRLRFVPPLTLLLGAVTVAACSDSGPAGPSNDPLAGLTQAQRADTAPELPPSPSGDGSFRGDVYGYDSGPDTLANAQRLAGVRVTAYVKSESNGNVAAGEEVASVTTNAQGHFQLPTLAGGEYVVTFVLPAASPYQGGWTTARAWANSGDSPWWIMLPRK